jgi:4-hydroxy-tetrahydrodipicolinate synthase
MQDAKDAGANAVLVLPPETFRGVTDLGPDVPYQFFQTISRAVDIQIIVFQNPRFRGYAYTPATLARLAEIENIVGVKLSNWDIKKYEQDTWALRRAKRRVAILPANDTMLFASYLHGADGSLIGLASLAPHWAVEIFETTQRGDIKRAREINDHLFPLVELFYETPGLNIYGAMKEALYIMGVLTRPSVSRPPLSPMTARGKDAIRRALEESGLMEFYRDMPRQK